MECVGIDLHKKESQICLLTEAGLPFSTSPARPDGQRDLFYDYRTNVDAYPTWQGWMREKQPRLLVIWGKYDLSFDLSGAGSLSPGCAERSSSRSRRRSFRIGHGCR